MKIGVICHSNFGGSAHIATEMACELARRRHRVHLFTRTTPVANWCKQELVVLHRVVRDATEDPSPHKLRTDWPPEELDALVSLVLQTIRSEGLDIVHFHHAVPFVYVCARVRHALGAQAPVLIGTLHGTDVSVHGCDAASGPKLSKALRDLDALTTVSNAHAGLALDCLNLPVRPTVIPNFVDLSRFRVNDWGGHRQHTNAPAHRPSDRSNGSRPRIIHVSNFRPIKDPETMARIFVDTRRRIDTELWLVGDGEGMSAVREIFARAGVGADVRYWGFRRDIEALLRRGDLLLVTSVSESFCLAALEAMACGVPVLAKDVGGLPEVVRDGETGLLFAAADPGAAANAAVRILSDRRLGASMGDAGVRRAKRFGRARIVSMYETFYRDLLEQKHPNERAFEGGVPCAPLPAQRTARVAV